MVQKWSRVEWFPDSPKIQLLEIFPFFSAKNFWSTSEGEATFVQKVVDTLWSFTNFWFVLVAILQRRSLLIGTVSIFILSVF